MDTGKSQMEWLRENWPVVAAFISAIGVGVRNEIKTNQLTNSVFDQSGDVRFVRLSVCNQCRVFCQDALRRELTELKEQQKSGMADLKSGVDMLIKLHIREDNAVK